MENKKEFKLPEMEVFDVKEDIVTTSGLFDPFGIMGGNADFDWHF